MESITILPRQCSSSTHSNGRSRALRNETYRRKGDSFVLLIVMMTIDIIVLPFLSLPPVVGRVACLFNEACPLSFASYTHTCTPLRVHFPSCSNSYLPKGLTQSLKHGSFAARRGRLALSRWATCSLPITDNDGWPLVQNRLNFACQLFSTIFSRFWSMPTSFYFPCEQSPRNPIASTAKA